MNPMVSWTVWINGGLWRTGVEKWAKSAQLPCSWWIGLCSPRATSSWRATVCRARWTPWRQSWTRDWSEVDDGMAVGRACFYSMNTAIY